MSSQLGPIDVDCDALSYPIVRACTGLGFRNPLDVRWCQMSQFLNESNEGAGFFSSVSWLLFLNRNQPRAKTCTCGEPLPTLDQFKFQFPSGRQVEYLLGQCARCNTMFWEEVAPSRFTADFSEAGRY